MKFSTLHKISGAIGAGNYRGARRIIARTLNTESGPAWRRELSKLAQFLADPARVPFARIFGEGNGKLPFTAFSALPGVTCPGAGDCLDWCYSFKSWRYPAAYARQAQNTVLLRSKAGRAHILAAMPNSGTFRLYVDGDFDSVETAEFWRDAIADRPELLTYGYSKSLQLLLTIDMPDNYRLNISSGHKYSADIERQALALPYARGRFLAVDIGRQVRASDHGTKDHNQALRAAHGAPAFTCPGQCGDCTPRGHACGLSSFDNVDIIIAAH